MPDRPSAAAIQGLISLLDDPDEEVINKVEKELIRIGKPAIGYLKKACLKASDNVLKSKLSDILFEVNFVVFGLELWRWKFSWRPYIADGAFLVEKSLNPWSDLSESQRLLRNISNEARMRVSKDLTPSQKIEVINEILFRENGFTLNSSKEFQFEDYSFHTSLIQRTGHPIILAMIYLSIAQKLNLPLYHISLSEENHFLAWVGFQSSKYEKYPPDKPLLFLVNPSEEGKLYPADHIKKYQKKNKILQTPDYFMPRSSVSFIKNLLAHMIIVALFVKDDVLLANLCFELFGVLDRPFGS